MADSRGASRTGTRLTLALLGYFVLVTAVITLSPFDFSMRRLRMSLAIVPADIVANIALFLPLGFLGRGLTDGSARSGRRVVWIAAACSLLIETAQLFLRRRYAGPMDVVTNTAGAWLGVLARDRIERWALWHPQLVGRVGLDVPLVGVLYLLVPQLWLSSVGLIQDPRRSVTTLLLGCAGSIVLVALHRHRWQSGVRVATHVVPPLAVLWFMTGALPAATASPAAFGALGLAVAGLTAWLLRRPESSEPRFEIATLRRFVPIFVLYLMVTSLWPPMRPLAPWHGALLFANRLNGAGVVDVLLLLEQVGGFTLLGYAVAEWRGRRELSLASDLPPLVAAAAACALGLEVVQGFLSGPGASLLRAMLSTSSAAYGVAVYHLARAHVRNLRAETPAADASATEAA
ncbi:MAG TPA: VanZ family protein [Vicinamibacterales bacterium]|jgi:VanZ family protein|nr:VanZ family protein [Vicinamibacterales bacterium]